MRGGGASIETIRDEILKTKYIKDVNWNIFNGIKNIKNKNSVLYNILAKNRHIELMFFCRKKRIPNLDYLNLTVKCSYVCSKEKYCLL